MLGKDIHCDLGEEEIRPHAGGRTDAGSLVDLIHEGDRHFRGRLGIHGKVGRDIHEALIDGVGEDVLRREKFQVDLVNLGRNIHVVLHPRRCDEVGDTARDLEEAAAVPDAERFQRGADSEAERAHPPRPIGHDQIRREGIQPSVHALDRGVVALEVDAEVALIHFVLLPAIRIRDNLFAD